MKNLNKTQVVFRVFKDGGDVLALFPFEKHDSDNCMSYQHVGQHGAADYIHCISITRPATPDEYKKLEQELKSIGYELEIRQRKSK